MHILLAKLSAIILITLIGVLSILGTGGEFPCGPDEERVWCKCPGQIAPSCKPIGGPSPCSTCEDRRRLSQLTEPDLSYTNLDGLVDFGQSTLAIELPSEGDFLETKLKGRVAIKGGVCSQPQCPLEVALAELSPLQDHMMTQKGRSVSDVFVRNANSWNGTRLADGTINIDANSKLAIEATVDGEDKAAVMASNDNFHGALYYNVWRMTEDGPRQNNRISISGSFGDEDVILSLTISIWATDCSPKVKLFAECRPNIESGRPGYAHLNSNFEMLGNLQSSQDLCDALKAPNPEIRCRSGEDREFSTFTCNKDPLPLMNNVAEIARLLEFSWKDARGTVISNEYTDNLDRLPIFPVSLTVENKWGKSVSSRLDDAPVCSSDVALVPGACVWEQLSGAQSHGQSHNWCPKGSFLTALDLEGETSYSGHDAPLVGYARCCAPQNTQSASWGSCSWSEIGRRSHHQGSSWCADNSFLTALDLDSDHGLSVHDSPIVGQVRCCAPAQSSPSEVSACSWVELGRRSHQRGGNWCPTGSYITALDLDSDADLSAHDSPIIGRVLCCPLTD